MSIIIVNKFCDNVCEMRFFDCRILEKNINLNLYSNFTFQVFEQGYKNPIFEKTNQSDFQFKSEYPGFPNNIISLMIKQSDLNNILPNPSISDKVREYRLLADNKDGVRILLRQDCFYVEDEMMGR